MDTQTENKNSSDYFGKILMFHSNKKKSFSPDGMGVGERGRLLVGGSGVGSGAHSASGTPKRELRHTGNGSEDSWMTKSSMTCVMT